MKPIEGFPNYEISSDGRIWSKPRIDLRGHNRVGHWMKSSGKKNWYRHLVLINFEKKQTITIHKLVATAFVPNPNNLPCINHIDGNKQNNNASNLEWCSQEQNNLHSKLILGNTNCAKLQVSDIINIKYINTQSSLQELATQYNVSKTMIRHIKNNKAWKHI